MLAPGCSRETRYEILTFFFTGVPPLDQPEGAGGTLTKEQEAALGAKERQARILEARQAALRSTLKFTHGPYGAGECDRCHSVAGSVAFRSAEVTGAGGSAVAAMGSRRLIAPKEELCLTCHPEKGTARANGVELRLHGPVGSGLCVACHSPHQSPRQYTLLGQDNVELCTQCHDQAGIRERTPVHAAATDPDCMGCHNPHKGRTAMLLRAEYDELAEP